MAAITPSSISADTVYGNQFLQGGQILVLPFSTANNGDTWTVPDGMGVIDVAWESTTSTDIVATTLSGSTVTFSHDGLATYTGNLIVVYGGKSAQ